MSGPVRDPSPSSNPAEDGLLLVIDTATTRAFVALGSGAGRLRAERDWIAGYRHGEELLVRIDGLLADEGLDAHDLAGIVVGTGPGAFTGLRVGVATAKALAWSLRLPIAGVSTGEALLRAAGAGPAVILLPAGASDRVACRAGAAPLILPGGTDPELGNDDRLIAIDLAGRAPDDALACGEVARAGLATALLELGAERLRSGTGDDLARLVPEYVTLPRGVRLAAAEEAVEVSGGVRR